MNKDTEKREGKFLYWYIPVVLCILLVFFLAGPFMTWLDGIALQRHEWLVITCTTILGMLITFFGYLNLRYHKRPRSRTEDDETRP